MKIRPLHDRILVKREEEKDAKKGRIIIPDTAKEKPQEGRVIAVGTGKVMEDGKKIPLDVKADDRILFGKYSGSEVTVDDEEYLIMKEEDVSPSSSSKGCTQPTRPGREGRSILSYDRGGEPRCRSKSCSVTRGGPPCSAESTSWRQPSRPPWGRRGGTW